MPTLALTAAAVFMITSRVEPSYEARASLLLTTQELVQDEAVAPAGQGVELSATIVAEIVQGDETRAGLGQNASADYTVDVAGDDAILRISAQDASSGTVVPTVEGVIAAIADTVAERRVDAGVDEQTAQVDVLARPSQERSATVLDPAGEPQTVYEASGSVALPGLAVGSNPYAPNSGTLRVLQELAESPQAFAAIAGEGRGSTFGLEMHNRDAAPIMYITATGPDPRGVMSTLHNALAYLNGELAERQEAVGAPQASWISLDALSMPAAASARSPELRRPLLTIVGLGLSAAVSLALLVDNFIAYRRRRETRSPFAVAPSGNGGESGPARKEPSEQVPSR